MKSSFCRHTMVSGWLHQARLIGSLQALVYSLLRGSDITKISGSAVTKFSSGLWYDKAWFRTVHDLWENQRGVSNVFLTYFDYFFGRVNTNLGG